jgi:hypothetical protein
MTSPVSRLPLDAARLALLQARPAPKPVQAEAAPPQRERPIPPAPAGAAGGVPRRGSLVNIVA